MELNQVLLTKEQIEIIDGGEWVDDIPGAADLRLKVRGMDSEPVQKAIQRAIWAMREKKGAEPLSEKEIEQCNRIALAEAALLDWENLTNGGDVVAYDKAKARDWLEPETGRVFAEMVRIATWRITHKAASLKDAVTKK